jgi:hypothetical protein
MKGLRLGLSLTGGTSAAFSAIRQSIEADSGDVTLLVIGDSTGNDATEWVRQFATWLGTAHATHTVNHYAYNITNGSYDAATVVATGSGANAIEIYNACIAGTRPIYLTGDDFDAAIGDLSPDVIIWNHGQNVYNALTDAHYRGEFFSAFEEVRTAHPTVPTAIILQNPRRDDDNMVQVIASLREVAPHYGVVIDVYSEFIAQGKDGSLYVDNVHPSETGSTIYRDKVIEAWLRSGSASVSPAHTSLTATNILSNGDFSNWTGALPVGWGSASSGAATKELSIVEGASPYSCKVTGTTAGAGIAQDITTTAYASKQVFLAVRQYVPDGMSTTTGRIYFRYTAGGNTVTTTRAATYGVGRFCWQMIGPISLPSNTTAIRVFLYCDSAANASSAAYYDRAILVEGTVPRDMA